MKKLKRLYRSDCKFTHCVTPEGLAKLAQFYRDNFGKDLELPAEKEKKEKVK